MIRRLIVPCAGQASLALLLVGGRGCRPRTISRAAWARLDQVLLQVNTAPGAGAEEVHLLDDDPEWVASWQAGLAGQFPGFLGELAAAQYAPMFARCPWTVWGLDVAGVLDLPLAGSLVYLDARAAEERGCSRARLRELALLVRQAGATVAILDTIPLLLGARWPTVQLAPREHLTLSRDRAWRLAEQLALDLVPQPERSRA